MTHLIHPGKTTDAVASNTLTGTLDIARENVSWHTLIGRPACNTRSWSDVMGWRAEKGLPAKPPKTPEQTRAFWDTLDTQLTKPSAT